MAEAYLSAVAYALPAVRENVNAPAIHAFMGGLLWTRLKQTLYIPLTRLTRRR